MIDDLLHELKIGRFQQAADRRHGALHNERVAGMQFQCCRRAGRAGRSSGTCGAGFSFNPAAADWADGYKLRGAKSQVCDRQERRSAT